MNDSADAGGTLRAAALGAAAGERVQLIEDGLRQVAGRLGYELVASCLRLVTGNKPTADS